jgi:hypothetical protein
LCEIGAIEGKRGVVRMVDTFWDTTLPDKRESLWELPISADGCHLVARENNFHFSGDQTLLAQRPLPRVRYADEPQDSGEVDHHPNAQRREGWVPDAPDVADDAESDESAAEPEDPDGAPPADAQEASAEEDQQTAEVWRFEEDFKECKPGNICVGLASTLNGPSPYIFVGQITSVNRQTRVFSMVPFGCNADTWKETCLGANWYRTRSKANQVRAEEKKPHYAVMAYTSKLLERGRLPKKCRQKVEQRTIAWHA